MSSGGEILILPAFGQGHLFPCMELCQLIASRNYKATLVIFSTLSSSVPSSFRQLPLVEVVDIPSPTGPQQLPVPMHPDSRNQMHLSLENLLSSRPNKPLSAIVDVLVVISWSAHIFHIFDVPTIGFFTSGACSAAMEYATWKAHPQDIDFLPLPGLPHDMALTVSDLKRRPSSQPPKDKKKTGLPGPGDQPPWVNDTQASIALMINTCDDLERPFLNYISNEVKKPVWGVGPLFPEEYWKSAGSLVHDSQIRTNRSANITEEGVIQWLDSKPRGSVLYVSFGSSVDLTKEEYPQLAEALEASTHPFIWVLRENAGRGRDPNEEGYAYPDGMSERVGERGLIIRGWAPQLLILSHPSTGGFLSHMGWNSTMEGIGRGVPFLAWPLRGDQYYDAKLVVSHLKLGYNVSDDLSVMVRKDVIVEGIDKLMGDEEMKKRAKAFGAKFGYGFPLSSAAALDAFINLVK
ncbi:UDP-glycosyltransferase 73C4 [Ricinus communis]|uniref:UDP-glucosyltransferase, putative n=1 Tax=Ricinus communis TaxID=3988 RepID=B9RHD9_RICCO|nr:UDP-glycosyltransferase 73C4 [Ricinus communis]EEF49501.1 UDP-glucosyltransferase, putative [Ricinus communis]|eukprot:XP_002512998.1 UDP-glycosyltransferase 73C7 [Ricinus communis]